MEQERGSNMLDMMKLISLTDKDAIMSEVHNLSETEAKTALIMALLSWRKGNEINEEIDRNLRRKITELEEQCKI